MRNAKWGCAWVSGMLILGLLSARAASAGFEDLKVETEYVAGLGQVSIQLDADAEPEKWVRFIHNPNACNLDAYGKPELCTAMASRVVETTFEEGYEPASEDYVVFKMRDVPEFRLRLDRYVELKGTGELAGRLLQMERDQVIATYPLYVGHAE